MPTTYIEPEVFMEYRNVTIYHCYKQMDSESREANRYTTDVHERDDEGYDFHIGDLENPAGVARDEHRKIIQYAIDCGSLTLPEGVEIGPRYYGIPATIKDSDEQTEGCFDAALVLSGWTVENLSNLMDEDWGVGWGLGHYADLVALEASRLDYFVSDVFHFVDTANEHGDHLQYKVEIDGKAALEWLAQNQPEKYWELMLLQGKAAKISGQIVEKLALSKSVTTHVLLDEDGEIDDEVAEQAIRDACYMRTILDDDHGWGSGAAIDVNVTWEPVAAEEIAA
jgi:hypothetical protein